MLHIKRSAICGSVFAVVLLWGTLAYGQTTAGTILGVVSDESGARLPGVTVTITHLDTGIVRSVTTDESGRYRAPALGLGNYDVKAELTGFRTEVRKGIQLTVAAEVVVNLSLSVGTVTEQVQVSVESPLVETTSATLSGLVDDKKIRDLPLNGSSVETLAFMQPGVTPYFRGRHDTDQGEGTKMSVSGSRVDSNSFLLDGTNINDQSNNTPGSASGNLLGVEMLREFRVLTTAYSAEYGRYSGGIITAVSKSGGNELHGNVYEFLRNDHLDARNFFDRKSKPDAPRLPSFKRNQFGATIGGQLSTTARSSLAATKGSANERDCHGSPSFLTPMPTEGFCLALGWRRRQVSAVLRRLATAFRLAAQRDPDSGRRHAGCHQLRV